jgi:amino acid permease
VTLVLVLLVFLLAVGAMNIGEVILIVGATANTLMGFNLPMIFYLRLLQEENGNKWGY